MRRTGGGVLAGLGLVATGLGGYIIWWSAARGWYRATDAMQGCVIGGVGLVLLSIGLGRLVRPLVGMTLAFVGAALAAFTVIRADVRASEDEAVAAAARRLATTFLPVCKGTGIPQAAVLGSMPRPVVMLTIPSSGTDPYYWLGDHPRWFPAAVATTQLVACFEAAEDSLDVCSYVGADGTTAYVPRVQYVVKVVIREARTATVVAERSFRGSEPSACPSAITERANTPTRSFSGTYPQNAQMLPFVHEHVEAAERATP